MFAALQLLLPVLCLQYLDVHGNEFALLQYCTHSQCKKMESCYRVWYPLRSCRGASMLFSPVRPGQVAISIYLCLSCYSRLANSVTAELLPLQDALTTLTLGA